MNSELQKRIAARGENAGFVLFKKRDAGARRSYKLSLGGGVDLGTLELEKWEGRWHVVGAKELPAAPVRRGADESARMESF